MKTQITIMTQLTALFLITLISGCAQKASLKTTFSDNAANEMTHILVLALGKKDQSSARQFEYDLAKTIELQGVKATSFQSMYDGNSQINEEIVKVAVKKAGATGVLVTQLKSIDYNNELEEGRTEIVRTPTNFDSFSDFFRSYEYSSIRNPGQVNLSASVKVTADLYETSVGKKIWSGETTTVDRNYAYEVLSDLSESISNGLKKNKLL